MHSLILLLLSTQLPGTTSLRGTVVGAESGQPLGFSMVTLHPNGGQQFTSASGAFTFADIKAGTYVLSVRQIGYVPVDTQVVITGRPDSSDAALLAVFDQLQENARRFELLADSYPFRYTLELSERTVSQRGDTSGPEVMKLQFSSNENHPYGVGRVVEHAWGPWGDPERVLLIRSADLEDLGNREFVENHCFRLAGRDTIAGETLVRIDFEPATRIGSADMAGAAYLDSLTYELRYTETRLTRPDRSALTNVHSMTFRTRFRNIARGVPLQDSLWVVTTYRYGPRARIGTQRTRDVRFRRQPPPAP